MKQNRDEILRKICNNSHFIMLCDWSSYGNVRESILVLNSNISLKDLNYKLNMSCLEYELDAKFYVYSTRINPLIHLPWDESESKFIDTPKNKKLVHIKVILYN
jgi:hypothetical protein